MLTSDYSGTLLALLTVWWLSHIGKRAKHIALALAAVVTVIGALMLIENGICFTRIP
jgi:hypothetical protein